MILVTNFWQVSDLSKGFISVVIDSIIDVETRIRKIAAEKGDGEVYDWRGSKWEVQDEILFGWR